MTNPTHTLVPDRSLLSDLSLGPELGGVPDPAAVTDPASRGLSPPSPPPGESPPFPPFPPTPTAADQSIRPGATTQEPHLSPERLRAAAVPLQPTFELGAELGRGGVGVVRLAHHRLLGRAVAIKSVNPHASNASAVRSLLLEAEAVAALEHPNVVPLHDVAVDSAGEPHVVLRRIEGRTLLAYIVEPRRISQDFGVRDPLGWHLQVLDQVCNAVHYAHTRGILHRDIKPDNVMIGPFGEVYVLDWGIAARLRAEGPPGLPLAAEDERLVGTPRYMAPEMARGDGHALGPATDVFLLGGLLYSVLAGRPPHLGPTVAESLYQARQPDLPLPAWVPSGLSQILRRAMATDPALRHPTALALRLDLQTWREGRAAEALLEQSWGRLEALRKEIASKADPPQVRRSFDQTRFGFVAAQEVAPPGAAARTAAQKGLRESHLAMAAFELTQGELASALHLLKEVPEPPDELLARAAALRAAREAKALALARERAERDPDIGQRTRIFVFSLITLTWTVIPLSAWFSDLSLTWPLMMGAHATMLIVVLGLTVWARESLSKTELNRRVATLLVVLGVVMLVGDIGAWQLDLSPRNTAILHMLLYATTAGLAAESIAGVAAVLSGCYLVGFLIASAFPAALLPINAFTQLLAAGLAFRIWAPANRRALFKRQPGEGKLKVEDP